MKKTRPIGYPGFGTKVAVFPSYYTNTGNLFVQNTGYFYHTSNIQAGLITQENEGFESPYDGRIIGVCHAFRTTSGSTLLPIRLFIRIRKSKGINSSPSNGLEGRGFRDALVTNSMRFDVAHGAFYPCNVPIKRKEWFLPRAIMPAFGASISGILSELNIIIEGE